MLTKFIKYIKFSWKVGKLTDHFNLSKDRLPMKPSCPTLQIYAYPYNLYIQAKILLKLLGHFALLMLIKLQKGQPKGSLWYSEPFSKIGAFF